jgi:hypothetical protein
VWVHRIVCSVSNGLFKSVCIMRCVVYWLAFVFRTLEEPVPNSCSNCLIFYVTFSVSSEC